MLKPLQRMALLGAVLMLLFPALVGAEEESFHDYTYLSYIYDEGEGLLTGEANAVTLGSDGYLWIGSYSGLLRYDGSNMVDYSSHLENSAIRALFLGSDGVLYIGTNGAGVYTMKGDVFTHLESEDPRSFLTIRNFTQAPNGTVYVASTSGVAKVEGNRLIAFTYPQIKYTEIQNIAYDSKKTLWAVGLDGALYVFNNSEYLFTYTSDVFFDNATIDVVSSDEQGTLYVASSKGELVKLTATEETLGGQMETYKQERFDLGEIGAPLSIKAVYDGTILITALNGFGYLDQEGTFHHVDVVHSETNILSANGAELDREGNYWVASSNYGVIRYYKGCFDNCNSNSDLEDYNTNAIAHQGGYFYVGTDIGVRVFNEQWEAVEHPFCDYTKDIRIRNLTVDTEGRVWAATYSDQGAICYDPAQDKIQGFGMKDGINSDKIRVVYPLSDGGMVVGGQGGANILREDKVAESYGSEDGMTMASVLCAMEMDGHIYLGTDGAGIYEITPEGLKNIGYDQGLTEGVILRMVPDSSGNGAFFICGSDKLFYCQNGRVRRLSNLETSPGSIFNVYDVKGRLWVLQNNGVISVNKRELLSGEKTYCATYGVACGLTGTLKANTWNWREDENTLYLATRVGVSIFYFQGPNIPVPQPILNSVLIDSEAAEHPKEITIDPRARRVTFDISELLFSDTREFLLSYQLEGFDSEESFTTEKNVKISYTNLKGGDYALKLRVIDPVSEESSEQICIPIVKKKYLTEMAWFYLLCALGGLSLVAIFVYLFLRHKTRKLLKQQQEQRRYIEEITRVFSQCVDLRDHYTNGHSSRVAKYTAMLAEKMGKSKEEVEEMYQIALLHDVGKISIPDGVLNKPGRLTDEEYALMKSHSERGYEVLKNIEVAPELAIGARYHHERYDGKGYPCGLKGDEIPEVARIISVADTFDAMYSNRPYRKKMEFDLVVAEIKRCSGTQLNPTVVDAFLKLVEEGAFEGIEV